MIRSRIPDALWFLVFDIMEIFVMGQDVSLMNKFYYINNLMSHKTRRSTMRYINFFLIAGLFLSLGCSSVSYKTDYDPSIDFSTYKTYMWYTGKMPDDDALSANPLAKKRVATGIDKALQAMGYAIGNEDNYDFIVIIHAGNKEKMQITNYGYGGYGYGRYGRGWGGYGGYGGTDVYQYDETTLVIDVALKEYSSQEERQERIDTVVAKMLSEFPPEK
jgi:hypothetical protein